MKVQYILAVALGSLVLSGCAKDKETMVQTTDQTQKRVHTQEALTRGSSVSVFLEGRVFF